MATRTTFLLALAGAALAHAPWVSAELATAVGGGAGGAAGAIIGQGVGGSNGAVIGGALGAAVGAGATTSGRGQTGAVIGAAAGGAAGAAVGQQVGGSTGAVVGAGAGGALGAELGRSVTSQRKPGGAPAVIAVQAAPSPVIVHGGHPGKGKKHGRPPGRALGWDKHGRH
ncbi:glycine zipper domain-containing protein [Ramlibacter rhizophilus]|uniref:glycine zipper domain-containing protein n=1 Tax=Ramlibacter rhizophilus TaxID=1781167 RepID=UPI00143274F1|nr:glycine zipper domain-containing protein [Ramlibacter rhizophilus]